MIEARHGGLFRAVIDCIIPADEWPSASGNDVEEFFNRILRGELHDWQPKFAGGLDAVERVAIEEYQSDFDRLSAERQIVVLQKIENDPRTADWFSMMIRLTHEGYYADRSNGGNPDHISWKMIGYDPRLPPGAI